MKHKPPTAVGLVCLGLVLVGPELGSAVEAPTTHSTKPLLPPRTVGLEELWRVGGADAALMFGLMVAATCDAEGRWRQVVHVAATADASYDGLIFLNDDRVLLVKKLVLARLTATGSQGAVFDEEGGAEEIEVVCGRLVDR